MLVLTRRPNQDVLFPNLGIRVRFLRMAGGAARIGIEAPPTVQVLRAELAPTEGQTATLPAVDRHAVRNRLNKVALGIHRCQQLWHAGDFAAANDVYEATVAALEAFDREWPSLAGSAAMGPLRRCRALLVEDDANERELLAGVLGMGGCDCQTAADGQEALEYLAGHEPPDVILLDMGLPRVSGPQTLGRIRSEPRWRGLKVFAVSGSDPAEVGVPVGGVGGVDAWLRKPLNPRRVWEAIRQGLVAPSASN